MAQAQVVLERTSMGQIMFIALDSMDTGSTVRETRPVNHELLALVVAVRIASPSLAAG